MVTKLKCAIVDDEPLARDVLQGYIDVVDYLELAAVAENVLELDQILEKETINLIFLDIQMPFMTGMDFLKVKKNLPMVIITTAFPNFALEGFLFDVVDYLLKPITFNHFFKAIGKAQNQYHIKTSINNIHTEIPKQDESSFFVKCENKYEKIFVDKILFVQALQNYVVIQCEMEKFMSLMPLKTIEENLNPEIFIRVHKSYLVAIPKIRTLENHELIVSNGQQIPISRNFRKSVHEKVLKDKVIKKDTK